MAHSRLDVYPQWFNLAPVSEVVAGTFKASATNAPVQISDRQVMEILGVEFVASGSLIDGSDANLSGSFAIQLTKGATPDAVLSLSDNKVIDEYAQQVEVVYPEPTETGGLAIVRDEMQWHDFASSGHGFLVATQQFNLGIDGDTQFLTGIIAECRVLYRLVAVSAQELIGLALE